jgi:hypothetical protein
MKLRAFVVMPFGNKPVELQPSAKMPGREDRDTGPIQVDFDSVWTALIEPALLKAGCEPFRADRETSAGDIRTDMFFELVTADLVVADLSIPDPNVYYELGIRDGACSSGVFIVHGGWPIPRAFDVAQDRSFQYSGGLFVIGNSNAAMPAGDPTEQINKAVDKLATAFSRALASDSQGTDSPLYSHLPGLKPANWEGIDISRARYFGSLQSDWQARVRKAQELNRPGHIVTIAQDAPTRIHRTRILAEAARALIGLRQFAAAEQVLEEILQLTPDNTDAQLNLAIVQINLKDTSRAEHQLRNMLRQHEGNPMAGAILGFTYRLLWYLEWKDDPTPIERAKQSPRLLLASIHSFYTVLRLHPEQYLSGYNALLLMAVAAKLFPGLKLPVEIVDPSEISTVVRYTADSARQTAEETGDYDTQFWSAVALSGLEMLDGRKDNAVQGIKDACEVPFATLFYLQLLKDRLNLLLGINFESETVKAALEVVKAAPQYNHPKRKWKRVVVFHGYPVDKPSAQGSRFPQSSFGAVGNRMKEVLKEWAIGEMDLAICAGSTECDIVFGEECLNLGAYVRLLIVEPTPLQLAEALGDPISSDWANRSSILIDRAKEVWYHSSELGQPVDAASLVGRHNRWILNTAKMEAETETETENANEETRLYGLILSDGSLKTDDPEDSSFFISEIRSANRYKGHVEVIDLRTVSKI